MKGDHMGVKKMVCRAAAVLAVAGTVGGITAPANAEPRTWHLDDYYGSRDGCLVAGYNGMLNKGWYEYQCIFGGETLYALWYLK